MTALPSHISPGVRALNPHLFTNALEPLQSEILAKVTLGKKRTMNKTEGEYQMILQRRLQGHEIASFAFEGMRLKWGATANGSGAMNYKPDFAIVENDGRVTLIEVKGPHIFPRDMVRFKGCRAEWKCFKFELWQRQKGGEWKQLL